MSNNSETSLLFCMNIGFIITTSKSNVTHPLHRFATLVLRMAMHSLAAVSPTAIADQHTPHGRQCQSERRPWTVRTFESSPPTHCIQRSNMARLGGCSIYEHATLVMLRQNTGFPNYRECCANKDITKRTHAYFHDLSITALRLPPLTHNSLRNCNIASAIGIGTTDCMVRV